MKCRQCPEWFNLGDFFIFGILFAAKAESPAAKRGQKDGAFSAKTRLLSTQNAPRFAVNLLRKLPHVRAGAARVLAPTARCEKQKAPRKAGLFVFGRGRRTQNPYLRPSCKLHTAALAQILANCRQFAGFFVVDVCEKQKAPRKAGLFVFGRGRRTRTHDPWFWRPVLYQLSYTPLSDVGPWLIIAHKRRQCKSFFAKKREMQGFLKKALDSPFPACYNYPYLFGGLFSCARAKPERAAQPPGGRYRVVFNLIL